MRLCRTIRRSPTRRLFLASSLLLAGLQMFSHGTLRAADNISGFVDQTGRVVFVNDASVSSVGSAFPKSQTDQVPAKRKVLAKVSSSAASSVATAESAAISESSLGTQQDTASAAAVGTPVGAANDYTAIPLSGREHIQSLISEAARHHQVDADLVQAIVKVESNYNPYAVSNKGARGLMQLIPATARRFGVTNSFDPRANLDGGIRYLKYLMSMFKGDLRLSLAAYNAGEMAVTRNGGVPPYRETQNYIRKIGELYPMRSVAAAAGVAPEPQIVRYVDGSGVVHFSNTDTP